MSFSIVISIHNQQYMRIAGVCAKEMAPPRRVRPGLLYRQKFNLILIHQRRQHLQLLSRDGFGEEAD